MSETRLTTDLPIWAKDAMYTTTDFHYDLKDRLKILVGWTPNYHCGVATEVPPGRTLVISQRIIMLRPSWWPWKLRLLGYGEATSNREEQDDGR